MRTPTFALALAALAACNRAPAAAETLPKLRAAIERVVNTDEENAENSALVEQVNRDRQLQGLTRGQLADWLGPGEPCSRHPICGERGFDGSDRYYQVGRQGSEYLRVRPALIVGFNRFGKVERTFVLRTD
ncbi:MAG: hypothetical protein ABW252_25600 [Polyangiales bacterium]